nr:EOG090X0EJY [Lepidurus arcticus]
MSEEKEQETVTPAEEQEELDATYCPPPQKSLDEILATDQEDESLRKYKEALLGIATSAKIVVALITFRLFIDPADARHVLVRRLALLSEGAPVMELDLTGDLSQLKKQTFTIKEGVSYRIRIDFHVQHEIVHGLKYVQKTYRSGIQVDKMSHMVGSYAPKLELQSYTTPSEDSPSGLLARGHYNVTSLFTDDDKNEHLKWEWSFEIKKDWSK